MPRNSAFKKATRAIGKTRDFFNYESPYPTVVPEPGNGACQGPCCGGGAAFTAAADAALTRAEIAAVAAADAAAICSGVLPGYKKPGMVKREKVQPEISLVDKVSALEKSESDMDDLDEGELSGGEDGDGEEDEADLGGKKYDSGRCKCETCAAARLLGEASKVELDDMAAYAAVKKVIDEQYREMIEEGLELPGKKRQETKKDSHEDDAGEPTDLEAEIEASLGKVVEQILAEKELQDVVRWACEKVINVTVPLGEGALHQMIATLITSAKAGSMARQVNDAAKVKAVQRATMLDSELTEVTPPLGQQTSQQVLELQAAIAQARVVEKSICMKLRDLRQQAQAFGAQSPQAVERERKREEKVLHTITRTPMSDDEYDAVSSRSLYFKGVLPNFSKNDVIELFCTYGEVEDCKVTIHSRNQESFWLGFFTMASSKAADAAWKDLNGKFVDGHALMIDRPPDARLMRAIQAQIKKKRAAKAPHGSEEDKEQKGPNTAPRLSYADKHYLAERLHRLNSKEKDEVAEIIAADVPAVKGVSKYRVAVDLDGLSDVVLLNLLAYFWKHSDCASGGQRNGTLSMPGVVQDMFQIPTVQPQAGNTSKQEDISKNGTDDCHYRRRSRAITKWDLLRGLKCAAEEFLGIGTAMAHEQYARFSDPSVMNAPNLPTGAYTVLRNNILAGNIGKVLNDVRDGPSEARFGRPSSQLPRMRQTDDTDFPGQAESVRAAGRDPVTRRWKSLKRDFPDVEAMISKLQPERNQICAGVTGRRHLITSGSYIVAADEESVGPVAEALGGSDVHGPDDLAAFTRRLAEIDKNARFQLEKPDPGEIDPREARRKELLQSSIEIIGRYPGLSKLLSFDNQLPYHPDHEEGWPDHDQR